MKYMFALAVLVAFVAHASALNCYECDYINDKECKGEGVDTGAIDTKSKSSYDYCSKISYDDDKKGSRSGLDDDALLVLELLFDVKNDECTTGQDFITDDATICICDTDLCNGSGALTISVATLLMAAIAKYLY